ncbi:hypothetical protein D9758_016680 [Tetrapyrgos nigripes]|uniref:Uncharacterized protein n=1 Tax=Tetrapyrgos nigripes TaxID=182062 RepID=A0A8H5FI93_9AGAR|nr:hypothetical protein D9758_016680 [Tetrapyrgos nigripes]
MLHNKVLLLLFFFSSRLFIVFSSAERSSFKISVPPSTDVWRTPITNRFNASTHLLLSSGPVPLKSFNRTRITFSANWTTLFDQGGILLHLTPSKSAKPASTGTSDPGFSDRWLKTGIEFNMDKPFLSTVGTYVYSDWSIVPTSETGGKTTIEVRREVDDTGTSLWVYQLVIGDDGKELQRNPLRQVTWFFAGEDEWLLDVRAMAARPASREDVKGDKNLVVEFEGVEIDVGGVSH